MFSFIPTHPEPRRPSLRKLERRLGSGLPSAAPSGADVSDAAPEVPDELAVQVETCVGRCRYRLWVHTGRAALACTLFKAPRGAPEVCMCREARPCSLR